MIAPEDERENENNKYNKKTLTECDVIRWVAKSISKTEGRDPRVPVSFGIVKKQELADLVLPAMKYFENGSKE